MQAQQYYNKLLANHIAEMNTIKDYNLFPEEFAEKNAIFRSIDNSPCLTHKELYHSTVNMTIKSILKPRLGLSGGEMSNIIGAIAESITIAVRWAWKYINYVSTIKENRLFDMGNNLTKLSFILRFFCHTDNSGLKFHGSPLHDSLIEFGKVFTSSRTNDASDYNIHCNIYNNAGIQMMTNLKLYHIQLSSSSFIKAQLRKARVSVFNQVT